MKNFFCTHTQNMHHYIDIDIKCGGALDTPLVLQLPPKLTLLKWGGCCFPLWHKWEEEAILPLSTEETAKAQAHELIRNKDHHHKTTWLQIYTWCHWHHRYHLISVLTWWAGSGRHPCAACRQCSCWRSLSPWKHHSFQQTSGLWCWKPPASWSLEE